MEWATVAQGTSGGVEPPVIVRLGRRGAQVAQSILGGFGAKAGVVQVPVLLNFPGSAVGSRRSSQNTPPSSGLAYSNWSVLAPRAEVLQVYWSS